jgi:hypothetical protein
MVIIRFLVQIIVSILLLFVDAENPFKNIASAIIVIYFLLSAFGLGVSFHNVIILVLILGFFDLFISKLARKWFKSTFEDLTIKLMLFQDQIAKSGGDAQKKKVMKRSFVERIGRDSAWDSLTRSIIILIGTVLLYSQTLPTNHLLIGLLVAFAVLSAVDAGLIAARTLSGQYGLIALEVKEIGRAVAKRRNGGDGGFRGLTAVFPQEKDFSTEVILFPADGVHQ